MVTRAYNWTPYIEAAATQYGVPPALVSSVIGAESSGRPGAVSSAGAGGLMQMMPNTFAEVRQKYGLGADRFDPQTNINAGTAYLGDLYKQFGNWPDAVAAYNAGPNRWRQVQAGKQAAPAETTDYTKKVLAGFGQGQGPTTKEADVPLFGSRGDASDDDFSRWGQRAMPGGLLEFGQDKNFYDGLGLLNNAGQTPSQPPRTDPAALPGATQTDRLDLSGRINELVKQLAEPGGRPQMPSQLQYMLAGAQKGVQGLAGVHDRPVGIGEMLGALGGGVTSGYLAGNEAQFANRANQFKELSGLTEMQKYQRGEATQAAKMEGARRTAAALRASGDPKKILIAEAIENDPSNVDNILGKMAEQAFPKIEPYTLAPGAQRRDEAGNVIAENPAAPRNPPTPPSTVDLGDGPQGPGVYARNQDGTLGPRLGPSINAPGTEVTATLTPEEAQQRGLPPPPANSPYSNPNLSPKGRSNLVGAQQKSWEKRAAANEEAVKSANGLITDMQRFQYLNSQTDTGGVTGSPIGGAVRSLYDANVKEMNSIRDRITPSLRQPGSGATSDFDARMFQGGTVGVDKPKTVNDNIATATVAAGQNLISKAQFEQAYFDAYQHTAGMEQAWQKYLNDNPIFDPQAKAGSYTLNTNRVDWQTYFRNGMKVPERQQPTGGQGGGSVVLRFDAQGNPVQ